MDRALVDQVEMYFLIEALRCSASDEGEMSEMIKVRLLNSRLCSQRKKSLSGFTLLELLVVMVIIGLLAGYVAPKYMAQIGKSEIKAAKAQIDALEKSLDQYRLDTGHYPTQQQGLIALVTRPSDEPKWDGSYLRKGLPQDPWGHPYQYKIPGEKGEFDLMSFGKDGQPGGTAEDADIGNW